MFDISSFTHALAVHGEAGRYLSVMTGQAVLSHKGKSHFAILRFNISQSAKSSSSVVRTTTAKCKVPVSSPGWVNTFSSVA